MVTTRSTSTRSTRSTRSTKSGTNPRNDRAQQPAPATHNTQQEQSQNAATISIRLASQDSNKMQLERQLKIITEQHNIPKDSPMAEFPMKEWSVALYLLDQDGKEQPANCFTKVTYNLHPSFENPNQTFHKSPFTCTNEGWGEFEMSIDMFTTEKGGKITVYHDLNFAAPKYENIHTIAFKNPSQNLVNILRETGPVNSEDDPRTAKARKANDGKKRKTGWDYEKLADALNKLPEDDLLHVIQMIHDNKSEDTYIKNDIEAGEFSVDLFTLPESLTKMVWDFLAEQKLI